MQSYKKPFGYVTMGFILGYWWKSSPKKNHSILKKKLEDENNATIFHFMTHNSGNSFYNKRKDNCINQYIYQNFINKLRIISEKERERDWIIILDTYGGLLSSAHRIMERIYQHRQKGFKVTAIIPNHALSAGTLIALSCDKILMDPYAELGPIDIQLMGIPAASFIDIVDKKDTKASDISYLAKNIAERALNELEENLEKYYQHYSEDTKKFIKESLLNNPHTHGKAYYFDNLKNILLVEELTGDLLKYSLDISEKNKLQEIIC